MVRRSVAIVILLLVVTSFGWRCGSSTTTIKTTNHGTLYTFISDTPICDVLAVRMNVLGLSVGVANTALGASLLSTLNTVIGLDWAALRSSATELAVNSTVTANTYNTLTIHLEGQSAYFYDSTKNPPINSAAETFTTGSAPTIFDITPPLSVTPGSVSAISFEFDLEHSLLQDSQGNLTGSVTPTATVTPLTASPSGGFGDLDGLDGFIQSVKTSGFQTSSTTFTGGVTLQLLAGTVTGGPSATLNFTSNTAICGPMTFSNEPCCPAVQISNPACNNLTQPALNTILTNSYAWVDGFVDTNGNFNTNIIDIGQQENPGSTAIGTGEPAKTAAFIGPILSLTKDSAGNVTGFMMFLREYQPPVAGLDLDSAVMVNLSPQIIYETSPPVIYTAANPTTPQGTNFAALPYGLPQIAVGEDVVVNGVYTTPPSSSTGILPSVAATEVDLRLQTQEGNLVALVASQPDNLTGVFTLYPCASMLQLNDTSAIPIYVFTNSATTFVNTNGLTGLRQEPRTLVKGLLFYEPASVTINGVTVPPGTLVMLAKQVTQLTS
jgi:hypothetical protein